MPNLMDLLRGLPPMQQTEGTGAPGMNLNAAPATVQPPAPPAPPPPPPSLWQRIQQNLMPTPEGLAGIISGGDISHARGRGLMDMGLAMLANSQGQGGHNAPGFGQALAGGVGAMRAGYSEDINNSLQSRTQGMQLQQQGLRAKVLETLRQKYPNFAQMSPSQQQQSIQGIFGELLSNGMFDDAGKIASVIPGLTKNNAGDQYEWKEMGGENWLIDKRTGQVIQKVPATAKPKSPAEVSSDRSFSANQVNKIMDDYRADTKSFEQVMGGWDVLQGATKNPSLATPFAITDAYARITNPGGIVRPTTMEMIDNMGSVGQRMRKYWEHNANGALPPDIMRDFQQTLFNIVKEHKKHYDDVYTRTVRRGRDSGVDVTPYLTRFDLQDPLAGNGGGGGGSNAGDPNKVRGLIGGNH